MRYLYGASVQGIQEFITQTGRLREIVGASEIVEKICTDTFLWVAGNQYTDNKIIRAAAGNIRYVFHTREACEEVVARFPKEVMTMAPGIRISQCVILLEGRSLAQALEIIESRLQQQRNRVPRPMEIGFMGLERSRRSGNVAVRMEEEDGEAICASIAKKKDHANGIRLLKSLTGDDDPRSEDFENQIDRMVLRDGNRWVAVVHADGNGMGTIIQSLGRLMAGEVDDHRVQRVFRDFSDTIDKCTKKAVQRAYRKVVETFGLYRSNGKKIPIRPLVIGGDDVTLVMRADLAFEFTSTFLEAFEEETLTGFAAMFKEHALIGLEPGLTACAGIAYVGDSYPFHYAHELAEKLCHEAKQASKTIMEKVGGAKQTVPSSLSFYKVQDSFIEPDMSEIRERTQHTDQGVRFDYGPYFLHEGTYRRATIGGMRHRLDTLEKMRDEDGSASLSKLRKWVTEAYRNRDSASFLMDRIREIEKGRGDKDMYSTLDLASHRKGHSMIMELLQLHGFND